MNTIVTKVSVLTILLAFLGGTAAVSVAGEKKKIALTKNGPDVMLSETKIPLPDVPDHEFLQGVYLNTILSPDPEWNGIEEKRLEQVDHVAGTGTHRGVAHLPLKSGELVYVNYHGTHQTITKDGGAWESPFQGEGTFVGGTGKYKNAKGKFTCKGMTTPGRITEDIQGEIEY
jgi:hypothetical protein